MVSYLTIRFPQCRIPICGEDIRRAVFRKSTPRGRHEILVGGLKLWLIRCLRVPHSTYPEEWAVQSRSGGARNDPSAMNPQSFHPEIERLSERVEMLHSIRLLDSIQRHKKQGVPEERALFFVHSSGYFRLSLFRRFRRFGGGAFWSYCCLGLGCFLRCLLRRGRSGRDDGRLLGFCGRDGDFLAFARIAERCRSGDNEVVFHG